MFHTLVLLYQGVLLNAYCQKPVNRLPPGPFHNEAKSRPWNVPSPTHPTQTLLCLSTRFARRHSVRPEHLLERSTSNVVT